MKQNNRAFISRWVGDGFGQFTDEFRWFRDDLGWFQRILDPEYCVTSVANIDKHRQLWCFWWSIPSLDRTWLAKNALLTWKCQASTSLHSDGCPIKKKIHNQLPKMSANDSIWFPYHHLPRILRRWRPWHNPQVAQTSIVAQRCLKKSSKRLPKCFMNTWKHSKCR